MSRIKLLFIIIVIGGLLVGGITLVNETLLSQQDTTANQPDLCKNLSSFTLCYDNARTIQLVTFSGPLYIDFTEEESASLREQANLNGYSMVVNGGYFRGSYIDAEYSGLLQIKGEPKYQIALNDNQLTHIVVYNEETTDLEFLPARTFETKDYADEKYTLFQTGPLVVKDGKIQSELISSSINGAGRYLRTLMGFTDTGEKFFVITRSNFDLSKLAEKILAFPAFQDKTINIINLDGGTSTAMFVRDLAEFSFGDSKRLPAVIGIK